MSFSLNFTITVGCRQSALAQVQLKEVLAEIQHVYPQVQFDPIFVETIGDRDQQTSLRTLGKTDFFTRDIDQLQLAGKCRLSIHSAKDLADPLPSGLQLIALTKGVDPSDSLVFRREERLETLPSGARIGASSLRREEAIKKLRADLCFVDIRGVIEQRLNRLYQGEVDGVVIAEAALIRLGLTDCNRLRLTGETVPFQGQLAVIACRGDHEMAEIFASIDSRADHEKYSLFRA